MVYLRLTVPCSHCRKEVEKTKVRTISCFGKEPRYQCFPCFKKSRSLVWGVGDEFPHKDTYYCQRCNYKYNSKSLFCPYCNKKDFVVKGNISVHDLL